MKVHIQKLSYRLDGEKGKLFVSALSHIKQAMILPPMGAA